MRFVAVLQLVYPNCYRRVGPVVRRASYTTCPLPLQRGAHDQTPSSLPRSATMSVAGQPFIIQQEGAPCLYVLSPPSVVLEAGGGPGIFEVNTPEGCTWTAVSNDAWLHVTAGDGTVSFSADANPGPARTGTIVAGAGRSRHPRRPPALTLSALRR